MTKKMKDQENKPIWRVLEAVPYQCCPVCNGKGEVLADGFTNSVYQTCKVCAGAMIIPMYIIRPTAAF